MEKRVSLFSFFVVSCILDTRVKRTKACCGTIRKYRKIVAYNRQEIKIYEVESFYH